MFKEGDILVMFNVVIIQYLHISIFFHIESFSMTI